MVEYLEGDKPNQVRVRSEMCNSCAFQPKSTDKPERERLLEEITYSHGILECHHGGQVICRGFWGWLGKGASEYLNREVEAEYVDTSGMVEMSEDEALLAAQMFLGRSAVVECDPFDPEHQPYKVGSKFPGQLEVHWLSSSHAWYGAVRTARQTFWKTMQEAGHDPEKMAQTFREDLIRSLE